MKIKIGDRVRFLNSVGGGIVRAISGKDKVIVEDESGFDFPVFIYECVVVMDGSKVEDAKKAVQTKTATPVQQINKHLEPAKVVETKEGEKLSAYLAFLPVDEKQFQKCEFETYFINDSNYSLFISYANKQNGAWINRHNGVIEPNTRIFLEEFNRDDVNALERISVQIIAFKQDKPYLMKNAISVELRLDTVKFYKMHCFTSNPFFDEDALLYTIIKNDMPAKELIISTSELQEAMISKKKEDMSIPKQKVKKPKTDICEVDLHALMLLDNASGLSNADILKYQIKVFNEELSKHLSKKGSKIVFIHGKGNGVLRSAIEKEIKMKYNKNVRFQDASFREYGFGATLVTVI